MHEKPHLSYEELALLKSIASDRSDQAVTRASYRERLFVLGYIEERFGLDVVTVRGRRRIKSGS